MGRRGPIPKSDSQRRLGGYAGHHRPKTQESREAEPGTPEQPEWLTDTAAARWAELVPELKALGVLAQTDGLALALLCEAFSDWRTATDVINASGSTYERVTAAGAVTIAPRPEVAIRSDSWKRLLTASDRFGLNPVARERVPLTNPKDDEMSDFEKYLAEGDEMRARDRANPTQEK